MMKKILFLITIVAMSAVLAVSACAGVTASFDIEEAVTETGDSCYKIVLTQTDTEGNWKALETLMKFNYNKIIPIDWYDGTIPAYTGESSQYPFVFNSFKNGRTSTASLAIAEDPVWTIDGADSQVLLTLYWSYTDTYPITASDTMIFEMYFKYADGVTMDDLTATDFVVASMAYGNGANWGYNNDDPNKIEVINNVVPEATAITIPVAAGDDVYLQDGTPVAIAEAGDYEVPATVGYVVVNSGLTTSTYEAFDNSVVKQATYYVDGASATLVHTNGAVARDAYSLRYPDEKYDHDKNPETPDVDRSGLRFSSVHSIAGRDAEGHAITEYGYLFTVESEKTGLKNREYDLNMSMVGTTAKVGYAFNKDGKNIALDSSKDGLYLISAVLHNIAINETNVTTVIAARPFYKVGETYVYGETTKTTLYNVAKMYKDDANLSLEAKNFVNEIIAAVEGWAEIVEDEVLIDISGLYA